MDAQEEREIMSPVAYYMKDKQELRNSLHLNNTEGACGAK